MPSGEPKNVAAAAIIERSLDKVDFERIMEFAVALMTPGETMDATLAQISAHRLAHLGTDGFYPALVPLKLMRSGEARDTAVVFFISHAVGPKVIEAGGLIANRVTRERIFGRNLATSLLVKDGAGALGAIGLLNRKPRDHEKEPLFVAALATGDIELLRQACARCGRESPTPNEMATLAANAVTNGKSDLALKVVLAIPDGPWKTIAAWRIVHAFGQNPDDVTAFTNDTLAAVLQLPESERPAAYEELMAVCVQHGRSGVAFRVQKDSSRKITNAEFITMIATRCGRGEKYTRESLSLAEAMVDGPDKIAAVASMVPDLVDAGDLDSAQRAVTLCGRKLSDDELKTIIRHSHYRGPEHIAAAVALMSKALGDDEVATLMGGR
jgi:hypothetical protein